MQYFSIILLFLSSILTSNLLAQINNQGAVSTSMAGANATEINIWSINNNISNIAYLEHSQFGISVNNRFLLSELTTGTIAFAIPSKTGVFGVSYSNYGNKYYQQHTAGLGYAMKFGDNFSGGLKINYDYLNLGGLYGSTSIISGDIGLNAKLSSELNLGIAIKNPTLSSPTNSNEDQLPTIIQLGLNYTLSEELHTLIAVEKDILYPASLKAALVYLPIKNLIIRGGIGTFPTTAAFGFGTNIKGFQIDFAASYHQILGFSPEFALVYLLHK